MVVFLAGSKNLLGKPIARAGRGEVEVDFWGTLPTIGGGAKTGGYGH